MDRLRVIRHSNPSVLVHFNDHKRFFHELHDSTLPEPDPEMEVVQTKEL